MKPVSLTLRRFWSLRNGVAIIVAAFGTILIAGCSLSQFGQDATRAPDPFERIRSLDLLPRNPRPPEPTRNATDQRQPQVYTGTTVPVVAASPQAQPAGAGDGYELNFENTPITTVAKTVLGDILGVGYIIDPRVQGTITLASGRPVPKADILYVLENALRVSNVVLIHDTAAYRLVPLGEAIGAGNIDRDASRTQPGYGISVVPLQYVSAGTIMKLLDSFAVKPGTVRADTARNMLLIQGSGAERRAAIETILSFDADWLQGQSVGIYPVRNSAPEPIITELEKIVNSGEGGLTQNMIKFQPISRMNSILLVSRQPSLLKTAARWIERLDNPSNASAGVRVYQVRYGEASQMAKVLNAIFVGGSSSVLNSTSNQIAPDSGATLSSSGNQSAAGQSNATQVRQQLGVQPDQRNSSTLANTPRTANASAPTFGSAAPGASPVLPGVRITADVVNNALLIYATQENYRIIERTLQQIDRPQLQVAIDATIAEVTLNNNLNYGVQFFLTSQNLGLGGDHGSILNTTATQAPTVDTTGVASAFLSRTFPAFNFLVGSEAQPSVILNALHAVTDVKVLSNPSLVVIDNQAATLQVGDQIPISTGSANVLTTSNTIVNTIDYKDTGIILRVVPRVSVNGNVRLDIDQEISSVSNANGTATLTPTVSERKVKSSISVASGQTVLLAGLISENQERDRSGIPLLDQLPGAVGDVFSNTSNTITRTELIIFIRPQIIRDSVDAHLVAEELRSKLQGNENARVGPLTPQIKQP